MAYEVIADSNRGWPYLLLTRGEASDCQIRVASVSINIKAHKCFIFQSSVVKSAMTGNWSEAQDGCFTFQDESIEVVIAWLQYLYLHEYEIDRAQWRDLTSKLCPDIVVPYRFDYFEHHIAMYEFATRHSLRDLAVQALGQFVACAWNPCDVKMLDRLATDQKDIVDRFTNTLNSVSMDAGADFTTDSDTDDDQYTRKPSGKAVVHQHVVSEATAEIRSGKSPRVTMSEPCLVPPENIKIMVSTIMGHETYKELRPIRSVLIWILKFQEAVSRPAAMLDDSYRKLQAHLLFTRLERLRSCGRCTKDILMPKGCEHGWGCQTPICLNSLTDIDFCPYCHTFSTGEELQPNNLSGSRKRVRFT